MSAAKENLSDSTEHSFYWRRILDITHYCNSVCFNPCTSHSLTMPTPHPHQNIAQWAYLVTLIDWCFPNFCQPHIEGSPLFCLQIWLSASVLISKYQGFSKPQVGILIMSLSFRMLKILFRVSVARIWLLLVHSGIWASLSSGRSWILSTLSLFHLF